MKRIFICLMVFVSSYAYSQWSTNPYENLQVAVHGGNIHVVSDGDGGVVITFNNFDDNVVTSYMQIVNRYGYLKWIEPKILADSPGPKNYGVGLFSSGDSNYIFGYISGYTYIDSNLTQYGFFDPYVQKIDTNGNKLWGEYGIKLNPYSQSQRLDLYICNDENWGTYALWDIGPNGYPDYDSLFIQRISNDGQKVWGENGIFIDDSILSTLNSWVIEDDNGGIYLQYRKNNSDYYVRKYNSTGNLNWTLTIPLNFSEVIKDGQGGIIISGVVDDYPTNKLIINRISVTGEKLWGDGIIIDDSVDNGWYNPAEIFLNLDSTVTVFWDTDWWPNDELFLQRYTLDGEQVWENHLKVSEFISPKGGVGIMRSDNNSNIIVWGEIRDSSSMYAQKVDKLGNKQWNNNDVLFMSYLSYDEPIVITDCNDGVIVVWRIDPPWGGIYAQQISKYGNLGEVITSVKEDENNIKPNDFSLAQNYPNPFNSTTQIKYSVKENGFVAMKVYDVLGKEIATLINEEKRPGVYEVDFNASNLSSGIYFYQLTAGSFSESKKMILLR